MSGEQLAKLVSGAVRDALHRAHAAPLLVDKQTLAQQLGCSAAHIDNLRKRGLPIVPVGEAIRFEPHAVMAWLKANGATQ